jgi:peptide/nickel transport system ATP-binding protein
MTDNLLSVRGLTKHFPPSSFSRGPVVRALEDISFDLPRGKVVGLVGESGSGKTTIGRSILRLIEPTSGEVKFDGEDLLKLPPAAMRRARSRMQYIFQDPFASLSPRMSIGQILMEGLDIQRIGIARALALRPELIVADEPVSALDVSIQAQVINLMRDLQLKLGLSMLFISHDLAIVEYICDIVIVLYLGRIMEIAPAEELYARPRHPYTRALLSAVPEPGRAAQRQVLTGDIPSPANPPSGCVFRTRCPMAVEACAMNVPPLEIVGPNQASACFFNS